MPTYIYPLEEAHAHLEYDPDTGLITRKRALPSYYTNPAFSASETRAKAADFAKRNGRYLNVDHNTGGWRRGDWQTRMFIGKPTLFQLAYFLGTGELPNNVVPLNLNPHDLRFKNLYSTTTTSPFSAVFENGSAMFTFKNTKRPDFIGIFRNSNGAYGSVFPTKDAPLILGPFNTLAEAASAYTTQANESLGLSPLHLPSSYENQPEPFLSEFDTPEHKAFLAAIHGRPH